MEARQVSADSGQADRIVALLGKRCVVLVGMMGAGKTSIGRRLAAALHLPLLDADSEIEKAANLTISEIFEHYGEAHFREGERRVVARLLADGPAVLATGGGAFMNAETRALCAEHGVWLHVDAAYGGAAALVAECRPWLSGLERADSITLDPHKWLYCAFESGCLLTRDVGALRAAFAADGGYLQDLPRDEVHFFERGPELSRGNRALKLWLRLARL